MPGRAAPTRHTAPATAPSLRAVYRLLRDALGPRADRRRRAWELAVPSVPPVAHIVADLDELETGGAPAPLRLGPARLPRVGWALH